MSKAKGRAKKYNGEPVDYVLLFDWATGNCIGKSIPDSSGNWTYEYLTDLNVGITYVSDGCEPITHGPYTLIAESLLPTDAILHYSFNGDTNDSSLNLLHGVQTGAMSFVEGRNTGTLALNLNGGHLRTPQVLPINSNKLTISFWFKTSQNDLAVIMGPEPWQAPNMVSIFTNSSALKKINVQDVDSLGFHTNKRSDTIPKGVWNNFFATIDRSKFGEAEFNVFLNGNQVSSTPDQGSNITGNFANRVVTLGMTSDGRLPYLGLLQDFRVYNRVLTNDERLFLLNE